MEKEIEVKVLTRRGKFYLRYKSPETGKYVERSTKVTKRRDAEKEAGKWQAELREGRYAKQSKMSWEAFRSFFTTNKHFRKQRTADAYESTLNVFERICNPKRLSDVTTSRVTQFATHVKSQEGRETATVARHLRQLKAIMRWAHKQELLAKVPTFDIPKQIKGSKQMRGRAITANEFDLMLKVVPDVVESVAVDAWKFYLRCLWESGLRLTESLTLRWDYAPESIVIDFSGEFPMLRIPGEVEKGVEDRLLPITREFAALLENVPKANRHGPVFSLLSLTGKPMLARTDEVSRVISKIGKAAEIVVDERFKFVKDDDGKLKKAVVRKYASAHDLRRSFGDRWSMYVLPQVLKEMMRHESVMTTEKFYIGQKAKELAKAIWAIDTTAKQKDSEAA